MGKSFAKNTAASPPTTGAKMKDVRGGLLLEDAAVPAEAGRPPRRALRIPPDYLGGRLANQRAHLGGAGRLGRTRAPAEGAQAARPGPTGVGGPRSAPPGRACAARHFANRPADGEGLRTLTTLLLFDRVAGA